MTTNPSQNHRNPVAKGERIHPIWPLVLTIWARFPFYLPALVAIGIGAALLLDADTFATSPYWRIMRGYGASSEPIHGVVFVLAGVAHLLLELRRYRARWVSAFAVMGLYLYFAACFTIGGGVVSVGAVFSTAIMVLSLWAIFRAD
jgi:hypothetical protein